MNRFGRVMLTAFTVTIFSCSCTGASPTDLPDLWSQTDTGRTSPQQTASPTTNYGSLPRRTNPQNAIVNFEPCTAYTASELASIGIDPASQTDIAVVDNFKWRGCHWTLPRRGENREIPGAVDQGVIRGQWQDVLTPDNPYDKIRREVTIDGYEIAVAYAIDGNECTYWVNVDGRGMVSTTAYPRWLDLMSHEEACQLADRFTRLMLPRLPR